MRILIENLSNTFNYGSMMMGENFITYFLKYVNGNTEFYVKDSNNIHLNRLIEATNYKKIYEDSMFKYDLFFDNIKYIRYLERKIREKKSINKCKSFYDLIVILGGDDYAETYYELPKDNLIIKNALKHINSLNKKCKLLMVGQTIGPYTGKRHNLAKRIFKKINIFSRDFVSYEYMKNQMEIETSLSRDLAFLDLKLQTKKNKERTKLLKKYSLIENEYITIVGTGLYLLYTKNKKDFANMFVKIIKKVLKLFPNKKIVWLSHVTTEKPNNSDNELLDLINDLKNNFILNNMTVINSQLLPIDARIILGYSYFSITCRMHAAISTFQMSKPSICLSYSKKYEGVIGKGLAMEKLVIECKNQKIWKKGLDKIIEQKIKYIEKNYPLIVETIIKHVEECKSINKKMFGQIREIVVKK